MGIVIDFPVAQRLSGGETRADAAVVGTVVILPVIRIERFPDEPSDDLASNTRVPASRKRRGRASRP